MASIMEEAQSYNPPQTKNIADLEKVPTDIEVVDNTFKNKDGENFNVKIITIDGEDYRVPLSVLKSLKAILEEKPDLEAFKVVRSGSGMNTEYTVIPIE
jgi:hypothetical protein